MIQALDALIKEVSSKPTWSAKELVPKIQATSLNLHTQLATNNQVINVTAARKHTVSTIKKYDILYLPLVGLPHYFLVHKIIDDIVYGIVFTSKHKTAFCIHEVKEDRILDGSFATNSYLSVELPEALESFVRVYECKKEADEIFNKITRHYLNLFKPAAQPKPKSKSNTTQDGDQI